MIAQLFSPLAVKILQNLPTHKKRKRFAKWAGPFFDGSVAKTAYGFPMIARWHDNANRMGFEGSQGRVASFIYTMPADALFLDIGANQGFTAIMASRLLTDGFVYAFEPSPQLFDLLRSNIALNKVSNIMPLNRGVSECEASAFLDESDVENSGSASVASAGTPIVLGPITCDDLSACRDFSGVYVKVDTEGYELTVLKGLRALFEEQLIRAMVVEIDDAHLAEFGASAEDVYDFLDGYGFNPSFGLEGGHYDEIFVRAK